MNHTQHPDIKAALLENTKRAHAQGAFGSPTFFVGSEMFFGKDRLRDVEEEVVRIRERTDTSGGNLVDTIPTNVFKANT